MKTLTSSPIIARLTQALTEFPDMQALIKQLLAGHPADYDYRRPLTKTQWCQLINYVTEGGSPVDFFVEFDRHQVDGSDTLKSLARTYRNDILNFMKNRDLSPYMALHDHVKATTVLGYLMIRILYDSPIQERIKLYLEVDELAGHVLLDCLPQSKRLKLCRSLPIEDIKRRRYAASYFVYYCGELSTKEWNQIMDAFPLPDPLTEALLETGYRLAVAAE